MSEEGVERKLTTILAADVVGYGRLMGEDEAGTLARLKSLRKELMQPKIAGSRGRIVKLMGDGLLAEFPSVVEAVRCAVDIQQDMAGREAGLPDERRIRLRIGVNLGDIIVEGSDIYGDGVNVAARLEGLAEPGGICISGKVYEEVRNKLSTAFEDLGEQEVKNIREPVRVYRWTETSADPMPRSVGAVGAPQFPDKPSIAVLPFDNMSGDPEQDYFADGVVEEIITALSRMPWLFVIARNSSFTYKGRAVDVKKVGRELGVRYILEGSVRKAGERLRITGQLVDAMTGAHLWADRYDGSLEDIFDLQDRVTSSVVGAIASKLELAEIERAKHKPTDSLDAYDYYMRGMAAFHLWAAEDNAVALKYFYRAIELDPNYATAYAMAARCFSQGRLCQPLTFGAKETAEAERLARRAADLGRNDAMALCMAGVTLGFVVSDPRAGSALTERALVLNPNLAWAWYSDSWMKIWLGQPKTAIDHIGRGIQLSPQDPLIFQMQTAMSHAHFTAGHYGEALSWAEKALHDRQDHLPALLATSASAAHLGNQAEAEDAKARVLRLFPGMDQRFLATFLPYQRPQDSARWSEGYRKAGFPK